MNTPDPASAAVTPDKLSALTCLTLDEVRLLAKSGYIPKAPNGRYNLTESIKGAFRWYHEARSRPITVSKDELRTITGLSDQRHRQLANEGHFPAPIRGQYQLKETCTGIIRYFRDLHARRDKEIGSLRKEKLSLEIDALAREKARDELRFVSVEEIVARLTPGVSAMRQVVLSSTLTEEERDQLIESLGQLLDNAIKTPIAEQAPTISDSAVAVG